MSKYPFRRGEYSLVPSDVRFFYHQSDRWLSVPAIIDTGATFVFVPERLAARLGLPYRGRQNVKLADGYTVQMKRHTLDIQVPGLSRRTCIAISGTEKVLLGIDFLGHFKMQIVDREFWELVEVNEDFE